MKKITLFFVFTVLCMSVMAEAVIGTQKSTYGAPFFPKGMSDNKQWALIQVGQEGDGTNLIWNLQTGKTEEVTTKGMSDLPVAELDINCVSDVADNGDVAGSINDYAAVRRGGKWIVFDKLGAPASITAITPDASIMVGWASFDAQYNSNPLIFKWNAEKNEYIVDTLAWSSVMENIAINGALATSISADGKIIVGSLTDNAGICPSVLWKYNEQTKEYDVDFFSAQYIDFESLKSDDDHLLFSLFSKQAFVSANGKWISGTETVDERYPADWVMGRYNVETKELTLLNNVKEKAPAMSSSVSNDGTLVGWHQDAPGMMGRVGRIAMVGDSIPSSIVDYYKKNNVVNLPNLDSLSHGVFAISPDSRAFLGMYMGENSDITAYCVDLDGTIKSAVKDEIVVDNKFCTMVGNELFINEELNNLYILNISGQIVYSVANPTNVINLSHLNSGVYVVVATAKGKIMSSKIMVL